MTKILFVCHGNICRSPAAEIVFRDLVRKAGLVGEYEIDSAATSSEELGNPVYPPMRRVLEERDYDCRGHIARRVRRTDYDAYDQIIGMDEENLWNLRRLFDGDPEGKLALLPALAGRGDGEVPDPWYTRDFSGCLDVIEDCCRDLLELQSGTVFLDFGGCAEIPALYAEMREKLDWEEWYGENLDALHDVLTGLPHRGKRFVIEMPAGDAPSEVRLYAERILMVFQQTQEVILL